MAREQGTFSQSANYELQKEGTIDARQFVDVFADLLNFTADNYIAEGFPVTVRQDSVIGGITYKKGWYQFLGGALNDANNWEFMGGVEQSIATDESLYLDPITNELRANVSDFSEKYTYTNGAQEFVLTDTPTKIIFISVNGQLLEDPLTQWNIDVPTKTITILDEMDMGDRVTVHYQYFITT